MIYDLRQLSSPLTLVEMYIPFLLPNMVKLVLFKLGENTFANKTDFLAPEDNIICFSETFALFSYFLLIPKSTILFLSAESRTIFCF